MKKNIILGLFLANIIVFAVVEKTEEKIVAYVNNEVILKSELDEAINVLSLQYGLAIKNEEMEKKILEQLIKNKLILQEAKKKEIEVKEEEIDKKLREMKTGMTNEEFEETLKTQNKTMEEVRKLIKENLMMMKLVQKEVVGKIIVEDKEIEQFYNENLSEFKSGDKIKMRQLVILFKPTKEDELKAKQKADKIEERIKNSESFEQLAKECSDDLYTKSKGGDFGTFKKGEMLQEIEKVMFTLKEGEISSPIKTELGYHIVKIDEKKDDTAHIRHILIKIIPGEKSYQESQKRVDEVLGKIKQNVDFIELVKTYSDDPKAKENFGELEEIEINNLALISSDLKEKIKNVKVGEISEAIKTDIGFCIFKVEGRKEGEVIPLDNIKDEIRNNLIEKKWIDQLKKEATIEIKN